MNTERQFKINDMDRAATFYCQLIGKRSNKKEKKIKYLGNIDFDNLSEEEEILAEREAIAVIKCDYDINSMVLRAEKAKARVIMPVFTLGDSNLMAMIEDSEGNQIGLIGPQKKS